MGNVVLIICFRGVYTFKTIMHKNILPLRNLRVHTLHAFQCVRSNAFLMNIKF